MHRFDVFHESLTPVLTAILATLPHPEGPLLDVGCGAGAKAPVLHATLNLTTPLVGLDYTLEALHEAVACDRLLAVAGDAHALPLRTASCGAAVCIATLGLLRDQRAALRELRRAVRPGGWVLVVTATTAWVSWSAHMRDWIATRWACADAPGERLLTTSEPAADLGALLQETGWSEVRAGAFVIGVGGIANQPVSPLLTREAVQRYLTPTDVHDYEALVADADIELLPLMLTAVGM
jgi:SAM-dependent methyltransferase